MTATKYITRRPLSIAERNNIGGISDIVAHLLFHRGIVDKENAKKFIEPDYNVHILDPFLLKDAEKSADRIIRAMKNDERIAIYADYDADGIPGAVMWDDFFSRIEYSNYTIYIPHRHNEGFGLNIDAIERLSRDGVKLLVTLDCGISDIEPVKRANELGLDVVITDHHEPPHVLPNAFAIVDHKQIDCMYPDKNLCGTAVGYKLIQAIIKKIRFNNPTKDLNREQNPNQKIFSWKEGHEKWLLDMVGIATLSDMVPLTGENRIFAYYGIQVLRKSPRKGLMRLLSKLKLSQPHLTEDDIAFMITPRINAASRMGVPTDAFKLLSADNDIDADLYAEHLDAINNERKGIVASLVKEVKKIIKERFHDKLPDVIVLGNPEWRPSLLGLVANTCAKEFDRPVFLWGRDGDNVIKGSCRSEGKSSVVDIMRGVSDGVFSQYGGHKHSGGFAVTNDQVHFFERYLNESAEKILASKKEKMNENNIDNVIDNQNCEYIDMELLLDDVNWRLQEDIEKLAPFGIGNPKPVFIFKGLKFESLRSFGKTKNHIEVIFKKGNGSTVSAISFFGADADWIKKIDSNKSKNIDMVASIEKSMFRGRKELRLRIVDILV